MFLSKVNKSFEFNLQTVYPYGEYVRQQVDVSRGFLALANFLLARKTLYYRTMNVTVSILV